MVEKIVTGKLDGKNWKQKIRNSLDCETERFECREKRNTIGENSREEIPTFLTK